MSKQLSLFPEVPDGPKPCHKDTDWLATLARIRQELGFDYSNKPYLTRAEAAAVLSFIQNAKRMLSIKR